LTAAGQRLLADCRRRFEDLIAAKLVGLSDDERARLTTSLLAVGRALRARE
jgi:DNA-binding MarR family transcriptional regulator